jgi:hypothetical protein
LPHNVDAERSILGAILIENHYLKTALEHVTPEDFFHDHHRHILRQMIALNEKQTPIVYITLVDQLERAGKLESIGGAAYLSSLTDGVPDISPVEHYARIVKEKALLRTVIYTTEAMQAKALNNDGDAREILAQAREAIAKIEASSSQKVKVLGHTVAELKQLTNVSVEYFAFPVAARGLATLLDGAAKAAGKSTLLLTSMAAMFRRNLFLNRATQSAKVLYVTEEYRTTFRLAVERAGLLDDDFDGFYYLTADDLGGKTWAEKLAVIEETCVARQIDWLIVDTFFAVAGLGGELENDAGAVDAAITPLRSIAGRLNLALTITRHTRKSGGSIGESGRGSTALTGAADTILELKRSPGTLYPERRQLEITGRVESAFLEIELRDGIYAVVSPETDDADAQHHDDVEAILRIIQKSPGLSQRKIMDACGLRWSRVTAVLAEHNGRLWRQESGPRKATLFYPI